MRRNFYIGCAYGFWTSICVYQFWKNIDGKEKFLQLISDGWINWPVWFWPVIYLAPGIPALVFLVNHDFFSKS